MVSPSARATTIDWEGANRTKSTEIFTFDGVQSDGLKWMGDAVLENLIGKFSIDVLSNGVWTEVWWTEDIQMVLLSSLDTLSYNAAFITGIRFSFDESTDGVLDGLRDDSFRLGEEAESAVVPEPTTIALLGIGLAGLAGVEVRRRRKKKAVNKG